MTAEDFLKHERNNWHVDKAFVFKYNYMENDDFAGYISYLLKNILSSERYNYHEELVFNEEPEIFYDLGLIGIRFDMALGLELKIYVFEELLTDGIPDSLTDSTFNFSNNIEIEEDTSECIKDILMELYVKLYQEYSSDKNKDVKDEDSIYQLYQQLENKLEKKMERAYTSKVRLINKNLESNIAAILDFLKTTTQDDYFELRLVPRELFYETDDKWWFLDNCIYSNNKEDAPPFPVKEIDVDTDYVLFSDNDINVEDAFTFSIGNNDIEKLFTVDINGDIYSILRNVLVIEIKNAPQSIVVIGMDLGMWQIREALYK